MDIPSGANNNDTNQQLSELSAPIVSTLTSATPITSEIVSDFETDQKFEITTLEMASYDCQDIYTTTNLNEEQSNSEQLSANSANSEEVHDITQQQTDDLVQAEQVILVGHRNPHHVIESHVSLEQAATTEFEGTVQNTEGSGSKSPGEQQVEIREEQVSLITSVETSEPNDCKAEEPVGDNLANANSSSAHAQAESTTQPDPIVAMQPCKVDNTIHGKAQDLKSNTVADGTSGDQAIRNLDELATFSLSQTSMDAQMEKVIDNIVELGGVHQFQQSLGRPEGKDEILASIHREITSERSSIDLIADVACRQKSIELEPIMEQEQNPITAKKESNLMSIDVQAKEIMNTTFEPEMHPAPEQRNQSKTENQLVQGESNLSEIEVQPMHEEADLPEIVGQLEQEAPNQTQMDSQPEQFELKQTEHEEPNQSGPLEPKQPEFMSSPDLEKTKQPDMKSESASKRTRRTKVASQPTPKRSRQFEMESQPIQEKPDQIEIDSQTVQDGPHQSEMESKPDQEEPNSDLNKPAEHSAENLTDSTSNDNSVQETVDETGQLAERFGRRQRSLRPRESLKRTHVETTTQETPPKAEPPKKQLKKSRTSAKDAAPTIKLPNFRSRSTISTSDPVSRLGKKYETTTLISVVQVETEKKFKCHQCGYATDRLNNLVYHSTKSFCTGKLQIGEVMKADIIKQQQQAKNKRRSMR